MLDLDALRTRAAMLADGDATAVSGSWIRQVLRELTEARALRDAALDFDPSPKPRVAVDLAGPAGDFTALIRRDAKSFRATEFRAVS